MTQNAFLALVRRYADLSRRTGKDFSEAVNTITDNRIRSISKMGLKGEAHSKLVNSTMAAAQREYGKADKSFTLDVIPF